MGAVSSSITLSFEVCPEVQIISFSLHIMQNVFLPEKWLQYFFIIIIILFVCLVLIFKLDTGSEMVPKEPYNQILFLIPIKTFVVQY